MIHESGSMFGCPATGATRDFLLGSHGSQKFSKACDDAVDRATQTSSKIVKAAIDELDAYRSTVAKWDTVLAIALALTAGALIAVRRSAIERVLSASEITAQ